MPSPWLAFCPYLPMEEPIEFGDWELGPLAEFEERWADPDFKTQAKAFLAKLLMVLENRSSAPAFSAAAKA